MLPTRMAQCTPDTYIAVMQLAAALAKKGGRLILSDMFRSYDMQTQSHNDCVSGRKSQLALEQLGIAFNTKDMAALLPATENLVQKRFAVEFVTPKG